MKPASHLIRRASIGALLAVVFASRAWAQCPPATWSAVDPTHVLDGPVWASTNWDPDGAGPQPAVLVIGGLFNGAGTTSLAHLASWDGATWQPIGGGTNGEVYALAVYNGDLIVGGLFTQAGGTPASRIARWNGTSWLPLGVGMDSTVTALAVHGSDLIAGGFFASAGGVPASRIANWNGAAWQPLGLGVSGGGLNNGEVHALTVYGSDLIAGGIFSSAGGVPAASIASWNGSSWQPIGAPLNAGFGGIADLTVYRGELIAAGTIPPGPTPGIARWNGTSWQSLGSGLSTPIGFGPAGSTKLAVYDDDLVVGGSFMVAGGLSANAIARWNGSCWQPMAEGLTVQLPPYIFATVHALTPFGGGLFVGHNFQDAGTGPAPRAARWDEPNPVLSLSQPGGPGTGVFVANSRLIPGHRYYNIASVSLCPGCPGSGPYGGLCFDEFSFLHDQLEFAVGSYPHHFLAPGPSVSTGPYFAAAGLAFDAVCADVTGGSLGCISRVARFTIE